MKEFNIEILSFLEEIQSWKKFAPLINIFYMLNFNTNTLICWNHVWLYLYTNPKHKEDVNVQRKKDQNLSKLTITKLKVWKSRKDRKVINSSTNCLKQVNNGDGEWVLNWGKLKSAIIRLKMEDASIFSDVMDIIQQNKYQRWKGKGRLTLLSS